MVTKVAKKMLLSNQQSLIKVADLIVDVPAAGGMATRCAEYRCKTERVPDITIDQTQYRDWVWPEADENGVCYMESGVQFYTALLSFNGMMLHASAVEWKGKAYLFSGPCGMGKSTHTRLWQQVYGEAAQVFNDDKPALRYPEGKWYAYGTPWCGKDGINQNKKVPLAGICFLKRGEENAIRHLSPEEALVRIISQTRRRLGSAEKITLMLQNAEQLVKDIPVFELHSKADQDAAILSSTTMKQKAEEMGL